MRKNIIRMILGILVFSMALQADSEVYGLEDYSDTVTIKDFKKMNVKNISEYAGEYHFGESEAESTVKIIVTPAKKVYIQEYSHEYDEKRNIWNTIVDNYKNVEINGNIIKADNLNAEFLTFTKENINGIIIKSKEKNETFYDFGYFMGKLDFEGKYPEMSTREIRKEELMKKSKEELKIMRNEVYARYGMIFQKNGDMDKYFSKQDWYSKQTENTEKFLTQLEKDNIKLVLEVEKSK